MELFSIRIQRTFQLVSTAFQDTGILEYYCTYDNIGLFYYKS